MSFVYVGMGFMAFLSATTLAIDVGMFMTARTQAQTSADAGALGGAIALAFNDFNDRSASGPAVQSALNAARANQVISTTVSVTPPDVTFPNDPSGNPTRVKVDVFRTAARSNPVPTLMGSLFGIQNADVVATATAEASPANAETCVKPFTIPDKWDDVVGGPWTPDSEFDYADSKGNLLPTRDVYRGPNDPNPTGYSYKTDIGREITLKSNNTTKITASFYNPWDLPGSGGASDYRNNIATCNSAVTAIGDDMPPENGNMVGPTKQGMQDLIDLDPGAYWSSSCPTSPQGCVMGIDPKYGGKSPRVVVIPLYDPVEFALGPAHGKNIVLTTVNYLGFFIEPLTGPGEVKGIITPIGGLLKGGAGAAPPGAFPRVIRLVQ